MDTRSIFQNILCMYLHSLISTNLQLYGHKKTSLSSEFPTKAARISFALVFIFYLLLSPYRCLISLLYYLFIIIIIIIIYLYLKRTAHLDIS